MSDLHGSRFRQDKVSKVGPSWPPSSGTGPDREGEGLGGRDQTLTLVTGTWRQWQVPDPQRPRHRNLRTKVTHNPPAPVQERERTLESKGRT